MQSIVTVCIPSYNHANYIDEAIESVIAQTYGPIELIIIDDGSVDQSLDIIKSKEEQIKSRFIRYEIRSRENKGLARTLNEALEWSAGKYFAMLSSDDVILPEKIRLQTAYLDKRNDCAGVFGGIFFIDSTGKLIRSVSPKAGLWGYEDVISKRCKLFAPTMLMRMSSLIDIGGYWEDVALEDRGISLKLTSFGYKLATVSTIFAQYRWHDNNTIRSFKKMLHSRLKIYRNLEKCRLVHRAQAKSIYGYCIEICKENPRSATKFYLIANNLHLTACLTKPGRRALRKIFIAKLAIILKGKK